MFFCVFFVNLFCTMFIGRKAHRTQIVPQGAFPCCGLLYRKPLINVLNVEVFKSMASVILSSIILVNEDHRGEALLCY